ncbi:MAG: sensor histidine kinase [Desulfobacteraceae bacterium]|nr:MAG: sensor histidine kinase [Desulfobacteraceae bacterium]
MTIQTDPLGAAGLTFFSKISASISHEIKNSLAVINESAGYLEDVTLMTRKGLPLDPERLGALASTMLKQVQRTNTIIKNMNRLAHSLDEDYRRVDLGELGELMAHLSERTLVTKGFRLTLTAPAQPVSVITHPFFLQNLIWLTLNFAMSVCGESKTILMAPSKNAAGAEICFSGLDRITEEMVQDFLAQGGRLLLDALNASCHTATGQGRLTLSLPEDIHQLKAS